MSKIIELLIWIIKQRKRKNGKQNIQHLRRNESIYSRSDIFTIYTMTIYLFTKNYNVISKNRVTNFSRTFQNISYCLISSTTNY